MSRPGMPYDNALAESFFSTLKLELNSDWGFTSREAARLAVFDYIEAFYNRARMHSSLDCQSPAQYEERFRRLGYVPYVHCPKSRGHSNLTPFFCTPPPEVNLAPFFVSL